MNIAIKLPQGGYIKSFDEFITYHKGGNETYQIGYYIADGIYILDGTVQRVGPAARLSKDFSIPDPSAILDEVINYVRSNRMEIDFDPSLR